MKYLLSIVVFYCCCGVIPAAERSEREWKLLQSEDTLDLYMRDHFAGSFRHAFIVPAGGHTILANSFLTVSGGEQGAMELDERRTYGFDGKLTGALQELRSVSGVSKWNLVKSGSGGWNLTVTTGGEDRVQTIAAVNENLNATYAVHQGIKKHALKVGDAFSDTSFDLTSAQHVVVTTRCDETPGSKNGFEWVLTNKNSITDRSEAWKLDTLAVTLYEEIMPFVARKKGRANTKTAGDDVVPLYESFAVPAARKAGSGERIRVTFDSAVTPDSSVRAFYAPSGKGWLLNDIPHECHAAANLSGGSKMQDSLMREFTAATSTMQSDDSLLRRCADSLVKGAVSRYDSIAACYRYVHARLDKRYTATFSNALETFKAGYGDCGEHAVLLGALLRAAHIPARVVLGLVYIQGKGYLYHAWTMARCGEAWFFADAALGSYPAVRDRVPLLIDDTGENIIRIAKLIGRVKIDYVKTTR